MNEKMNDISTGNAAVIAGICLLLMAILAPIANFAILNRMVVPDNAAQTFQNIVASEGSLRIAVCLFLIVAVLDIIVAWALYVFLKTINKSLSLLAAWFRVVYAALLAVLTTHLIHMLQLTTGSIASSAFEIHALHAETSIALNHFTLSWEFGLLLFGFHLVLLGYLLWKAGYMRRILGILVIIASIGYFIDGFGKILSARYDTSLALYTFIGEVVFIFWLFIEGRKSQRAS